MDDPDRPCRVPRGQGATAMTCRTDVSQGGGTCDGTPVAGDCGLTAGGVRF
ncbi:hypothetical protein [Kineococcus sp. G2]|uniref:hypothetical protein n=1 Tax=Kineococcus sp. G2 TaxID=3127484 RepID=UPI00301D98C5